MSNAQKRSRKSPWIIAAIAVITVVAMGTIGTTYLTPDEAAEASSSGNDPKVFAEENYESLIVAGITENAVELPKVAQALADDPAAAAEEYGVGDGPSPTYSVSFTGVVSEYDAEAGNLLVDVEGMPDESQAAIQTGNPGIIGTALRDATGEVSFSMFTNQLDYQEVGAVFNQMMKESVLDPIDVESLVGKTVTVTGATAPLNPQLIVVTPVSLEVGK
ncbi:DUF2291 family protein [Paramicrobacterium agarici]|uniref:Putative lipoprotein n=1 Tax=Paramicrobacterium agarici TaxID=630514 RepID=A0A2A9DZE8_9MICO|nr:DUF2291 family protein [Microbacterium agarici]PFG31973.1 putative lipoprotein [Microbacterium agarici]TQO21864.1 putative lipoprotein [Microbacterium agarici]